LNSDIFFDAPSDFLAGLFINFILARPAHDQVESVITHLDKIYGSPK